MAGALIGGAALGVAFDRFFATFVGNCRKVAAFSSDVNKLESTLSQIKPIIEDIEELNKLTGPRPAETDMLIKRLNECEALIKKCSEHSQLHQVRSIWKKAWYSRKLAELEKSLSRFFMYGVYLLTVRDMKKIMAKMNVVDDKIDKLLRHPQNTETELANKIEEMHVFPYNGR